VNVLGRIHAALVPGGLVLDAQPVSPGPRVEVGGEFVGTLDLSEWGELITAVSDQVDLSTDAGHWEPVEERRYVVTDTFARGDELIDTVATWYGARVPRGLERLLRAAPGAPEIHQDVRMRVLRAV
jgi:hypothetical protein